ncbi:DNA phosphorothioation system sulfurtransferase DndC [Photobacterium phosphoreum]|uniref:DNA phosphorothioation system sulfurtransferase DndC n=1 Tax=Photobacterium phosphoreum TaxID=659 RepID=UPI001E44310F|nr:DNA phosphorothioation system sulfurtransferase DndC [Photobacterium phosphoreum]MCD9475466.1 phosphoadenosine phosphosulfate reductase family protein [Photobacterium phosphoreum]MCF2176070.1 phosphoadenosine phosphosulfate reductase family protein [Photobacterium phosphoreum]
MAKFFTADGLDEEQIDYIENEFFAGFKRYSNHDSLPEKLEHYASLDEELRNVSSTTLCRELLREQKNTEGFTLKHFIDDIQTVYCADNRPWVIGYSGGKDSSAVVTLVYLALQALNEDKRTKHVYIVASDTLVETPLVVDHVNKSLESIGNNARRDGLPISTHKVLPKPNETFWSCLLGKGYPAPTKSFRWCTERMKIDPVSDFITDKVAKHDEVIVVLGSRSQESASRAQVIAKHKIENTRLARHTTLANAFIYTPIDTWSMDDVWKILRACSLEVTISPMGIGKKWSNDYGLEWENPWGGKNLTLWNLYKDSSDQGECPMVIDDSTPSCGNSRFGCWTCTVVTKDRAMESLIQNGEEWMRPLLDFRNMLADTNVPENKPLYRNFKRRTGKVSYQRVKDGQELTADREHVPGPYMLKFRKQWVKQLLIQEKAFNESGYQVTLITKPELHAIRQEWLNDPNEPDWADSLPSIYRDIHGTDLDWVMNDNNSFGEVEAQILQQLGNDYDVAPEMIQKLLDLEISLEGLSRRTGVFDKIGSLLKRDWGSLEDIKEKHAQLQSKADLDVHKDQINKYEDEIAQLDRISKVEL